MSRYTGADCKLCRREGIKLFLKGERCYTAKCGIERRAFPPGMHGKKRRKPTQYSIQLREKQKLRRIYGVSETQFKNYFYKAERQKGVVGENFLILLERRLDNVVYRMGFANSRDQARQLVTHGHFLVDGRKLNIPSYLVKPGQKIELKEDDRSIPTVVEAVELSRQGKSLPWIKVESEKFTGEVVTLPAHGDIDAQVNVQLIVEFYSK